MVIRFFKYCLIFIFIQIIVIFSSVFIIGIKSPTIGIYPITEIEKTWLPSSMSRNISETLSLYLIENRIYPRPTNLTNLTYRRKIFAYNNVLYPLFVTMADGFYLPAVRNFQSQLKNFGLEKNFIVICLDSECVKLSKSHNIFAWWGFVNASVARVKVIIRYFIY
jgi:hypothetical protein